MMDRIVLLGSDENLVGILSEGAPLDSNRIKPAIIIFNAGMIHRVGPHRIFCRLARILAENGFDVLRFDFSGIGDSDYRKDNLPEAQSVPQEVGTAMNFLSKDRRITSFILMGLCSGASIAFQTAAEDPRIVGAVLINVQPPDTPVGDELASSSVYLRKSLFSTRSWINFIFGQSNYSAVFNAFKSRIKNSLFRQLVVESEDENLVTYIKTAFNKFMKQNQHLLIISSGIEVGMEYLRHIACNELKKMENLGLLKQKEFPEADHTFTPLNSQKRLFAAIQDWVQTIAPD